MNFYNGYSPEQRNRITAELHRRLRDEGLSFGGQSCGMCGDADRPADSWHSEDYSQPYSLQPPESYPICKTCHSRLHKRFGQPNEWKLFLEHVKCGGYGREFVSWYSLAERRRLVSAIEAGGKVELPRGRERDLAGSEWWLHLSLDPASMTAAWARPRPLRPRPPHAEYERALKEIQPTEIEWQILRFHVQAPHRSVTMRAVANIVLSSELPASANLAYGSLAHRLSESVGFVPDLRDDGSPIWLSAVAEGWQPEGGEYEWVMIPTLARVVA